jgi:hypothetical protein
VDRDTRDLALGPGGYESYSADPVFVAGVSAARKDWPYVIPGPDDSWAANRRHTFEIRVGLSGVSPSSMLRLKANFVETHSSAPPLLRLTVNGRRVQDWQAPAGKGDAGVMGHPGDGRPCEWVATVPASLLNSGNNDIAIRSLSGSWAVFDAVELDGSQVEQSPIRPALELSLTPPGQMVLRTPNGPARELTARVVNIGPPIHARIIIDGRAVERDIQAGPNDIPGLAPSSGRVTEATVSVTTSDGRSAKASIAIRPARPWRIFLLPHSHVDIGYSHPQEIVAQIQSRNLADALDLVEATRNRPAPERFRWNSETSWAVEQYLSRASPADRKRLTRAIAAKEIFVSRGYANMLYGLCRPEEMLRALTLSRLTAGRTATLTDVPGVPWGLTSALREAGISNFVYWPNNGDIMQDHIENLPFWWQGPDGSRVFYWSMVPYSLGASLKGWAHMAGAWYPGVPKEIRTQDPSKNFLDDWLSRTLDQISDRYPYDILPIEWSLWDNGPVDADVPDAVALWNKRYASPQMEIVSLQEACDRFLEAYGGKLPTIAKDFGPQWEDGAASSARETAMNRAASSRLAQAEIAWSLFEPSRFPAARFREAWRNVLLYSEHTWGSSGSISDPDSENQRREWATKSGFAHDADRQSRDLLAEAADRAGPGFEVMNTSLRPRTGLIEIESGRRVLDAKGQEIPSQQLSNGRTAFLATSVPPLGVRRYTAIPRSSTEPMATADDSIQNDLYRVQVDPSSGRIASLKDRRTGAELAGPGFAVYGYILGDDPAKITHLRDVRVERLDDGPLVWTLRVVGQGDGTIGPITETVRLVKGVDSVEIDVHLNKKAVRQKEIAYFSFPFAPRKAEVHFEGPWCAVDPATQLFPSANDQFFTLNRWAHVQSGNSGATVVAPDAPVVVQGVPSVSRLGKNQRYDTHSASLHFQLAQNHWFTNYRADQSGPIDARFFLRASSAYDPGACCRFGEDQVRPLLAVPARAPSLPFSVEGDVELSALKPVSGGWIVRVYGDTGKAVQVRVKIRAGSSLKLFASDGLDRKGNRLRGEFSVPGFGVRTVMVAR